MTNDRVSRRTLLRASAIGAGVVAAGVPGVAFAQRQRPVLTHGVQTGDVTTDGAIVWTRADRPSHMLVEVSYDERFKNTRTYRGPVLSPETGGTGKLRLDHLASGRTVHYRVTAEDLDGRASSEALTGSFHTAPNGRESVRFTWSGDVAGQGWGINPDTGGMTAYRSMLNRDPDFFLHSGDTVYADGPLVEKVTLADGRVWRNIVTPEKSKVAETLDEFRGQHAYNLIDDNVRAFAARVPAYVQWDDHETLNNWYPGEILDLPQYTEKRVDVLAARAFQAFHEWQPIDRTRAVDGRVYRSFSYGRHLDVFLLDMRTYKDANTSPRDQPGVILGERQARWLVDSLSRSKATWKIVANDLPIGLTVPDGADIEGVANGLPGVPGGREHELAGVFPYARAASGAQRRVAYRGRALHRCPPLLAGPRRGRGLRPVLGVRVRSAARRCVRPQRVGPDVRPAGGLPAHADDAERVADGRVPALRRGQHRRRQRRADG